MPVAYWLVAMWVSFVGGIVSHDVGSELARKHAEKPLAVIKVHTTDKPSNSAFDGVRP